MNVEFLYHGLGNSTLAAVDQATGSTNASFSYAPFGEVIEATDSVGVEGLATHKRRMNDKFVDDISGLSYYGFRYYDSVSMTWSQGDELFRFGPDAATGTPRRANLYQFSLNNPVRYLDPDGTDVMQYGLNIRKATQTQEAIQDVIGDNGTVHYHTLSNEAGFVYTVDVSAGQVHAVGNSDVTAVNDMISAITSHDVHINIFNADTTYNTDASDADPTAKAEADRHGGGYTLRDVTGDINVAIDYSFFSGKRYEDQTGAFTADASPATALGHEMLAHGVRDLRDEHSPNDRGAVTYENDHLRTHKTKRCANGGPGSCNPNVRHRSGRNTNGGYGQPKSQHFEPESGDCGMSCLHLRSRQNTRPWAHYLD